MNKKLFYLLNLTWGLPLNIIGGLVALALLAQEHNPHRFGWCICFEVGRGWGGLNLGLVILCEVGASDSLKSHELGHAVQNAILGILTPFIIHIPSAIRYHIRNKRIKQGHPVPPYDAVWFEGQATRIGQNFLELERR